MLYSLFEGIINEVTSPLFITQHWLRIIVSYLFLL